MRKVDYVIQIKRDGRKDVDIVNSDDYIDTYAARGDTMIKLSGYRAAAPWVKFRAIVRIMEEFPISDDWPSGSPGGKPQLSAHDPDGR